jgi:hypothetical protein
MTDISANKNAENLTKDLKYAFNKQYQYVYFSPTPSFMKSTDLKSCYAPNNNANAMMSIGDYYRKNNIPNVSDVLHTRDTCKFNAGLIQSKNRSVEEKKIRNELKKTPGLTLTIAKGYFKSDADSNPNPGFFLNPNTIKTSIGSQATDFTNIQAATNNMLSTGTPQSFEWFGYLIPDVNGLWTFTVNNTDTCLIWIGESAIYDYKNDTKNSNVFMRSASSTNNVGSMRKSIQCKKRIHYPIRIQYGHALGNPNLNILIKKPNGENGNSNLFTLQNADGSIYLTSVTYYSLVETDKNASKNGLYNCYITNDLAGISPTPKGCSGTGPDDGNGTYKFTTNADHKTGTSSYYPYRITSDQHLNKFYLADLSNHLFKNISKKDTSYINSYIKYADFHPDPNDKTGEKVKNLTEAEKKCTDDPNCNFYYFTTDSANNNYFYKGTTDSPHQYIPNQKNGTIKTSDLYIRNRAMKSTYAPIYSKIPTLKMDTAKNVGDYSAYSDYQVLPVNLNARSLSKYLNNTTTFDPNINDTGLDTKTVNELIRFNNNYGTVENFDNHGFKPPNSFSNSNIINDISLNQVAPLKLIARDYSGAISQINKNYYDLSNGITNTAQLWNTLANDQKYDLSGNLVYYHGINTRKSPTIQDALNDDVKSIILQQNTIYMLGSVTAASLLILAIFLGK